MLCWRGSLLLAARPQRTLADEYALAHDVGIPVAQASTERTLGAPRTAGRIVPRARIRVSGGRSNYPALWSRSQRVRVPGTFELTQRVVFGWVRGLRGRTQPNTVECSDRFRKQLPDSGRNEGPGAEPKGRVTGKTLLSPN